MQLRTSLATSLLVSLCLFLAACVPTQTRAELAFPTKAKRILFLGDSITHNGQYVAWVETQFRLQGVEPMPEFINIGLSSETCSGLSEPGHPFPRPDVHTRLDAALAKVKPDLVVACYGMNDGIYYPFGEDRFAAFQAGVNKLIDKTHKAGAKLVLMTSPPFDKTPLLKKGKLKPAGEDEYAYFAMYEDYDDVLARYARWGMSLGDKVEMLIDLRTPLLRYVNQKRKENPGFTLSPDGIHPNSQGHAIIGDVILEAWGFESTIKPSPELLALANRRAAVLHDAWLTEVGHKRPGTKAGLPLPEANARAAELLEQMEPLIKKESAPQSSKRASGDGTVFQTHYPATADGLKLSVDYYLWVPDGAKTIRGVLVHQHGCGVGASLGGKTAADDLHWRALAKKWDCALLGSCYQPEEGVDCRSWCDARRGSGERFVQALIDFAERTKRPEIASAPWCLWGHSGGGFWASLMQAKHPERIVAIWLRSGTAFGYWTAGEIDPPELSDAVYQIPVMGNPGLKEKGHERFHKAWDGLTAMQNAYRKQGAFFELAPDPRTGHECGDSRYLSIPWFDFWLRHRLPEAGSEQQSLRPISQEARKQWEAELAPKLAEYIETGGVKDATPPPSPRKIQALRNDDGSVSVTWTADADFESGIGHFLIYRDGELLAQFPEKLIGRFGRPLFQTMSYHDTPETPLPEMKFIDKTAPKDDLPEYAVVSVNSVGLKSNKAEQ